MMKRRSFNAAATLALAGITSLASKTTLAQQAPTSLRFQLDWRFEGNSAPFLTAAGKNYFKAENLDVLIDAGTGSARSVAQVVSGIYDMGFADTAALMEYIANNPNSANKPVAVMMVYNNTPATVFALKKSGIKTPADLTGKKIGAPPFDAGRRTFPIFQKINNVGAVNWLDTDSALRETMLARGETDATTGFYFSSLLSLEARGVFERDLIVMPFSDYGVKLYGNAIIVNERYLKKNPEAVKAFLRAFTKGMKDTISDPAAAIAFVKTRNNAINSKLEKRRLELLLRSSVITPDARKEGFGDINRDRLRLMASQITETFATKNPVDADTVWDGGYLPADRNIFPAA